jgi:allantoinase
VAADLDLVVRARRAIVGGEERPVCVGVTGGRIATLTSYDDEQAAARTVTLADDEVLIPGLVDTHVHVNEPGRTEWEGFDSATRAAAAGGVTTIVDMPLNSVPPTVTVDALRAKQDAARGRVHVDVGFWGGAVPAHLGDLAALHEAGVFGFKGFLLDSGVAEFPHLSAGDLEAAMTETARLGSLLLVHAEDGRLIDDAPDAGPSYRGFLASRPPASEDSAIALVVDTARRTGGRAHIVHLSSAGALPGLHAARADGIDVSVETCPHYLTLTAEEVPDRATEFKCCPPIRDLSNQQLLWSGLIAGDIDFVVTDHSPSTADLKVPDFGHAWGGISSLQVGLAAVWTAAGGHGARLADVVRWMATAPADRVGLAQKGRIAIGADADLAVLAPDETFVVDVARLHHKNQVSAYAGRTLQGVVRRTFLAGREVDLDAGEPRGRLLTRGPT